MFHISYDVQGRLCGYIWSIFYLRIYYDGYVFIIRSNMGLYISAKVPFICNVCLLKLYLWSRSNVFSDWPFLSLCSISNVWSFVLYVCPVSSIKQTNSGALVRQRIVPTERPPLVGEVSANFSGWRVSRSQRNESPRPLISVF
jgi:hypothetical protein